MRRQRSRAIRREQLPWAFGLLAISVFHVANGNSLLRGRSLGLVVSLAMGVR